MLDTSLHELCVTREEPRPAALARSPVATHGSPQGGAPAFIDVNLDLVTAVSSVLALAHRGGEERAESALTFVAFVPSLLAALGRPRRRSGIAYKAPPRLRAEPVRQPGQVPKLFVVAEALGGRWHGYYVDTLPSGFAGRVASLPEEGWKGSGRGFGTGGSEPPALAEGTPVPCERL
jgi:hypothetical protein